MPLVGLAGCGFSRWGVLSGFEVDERTSAAKAAIAQRLGGTTEVVPFPAMLISNWGD